MRRIALFLAGIVATAALAGTALAGNGPQKKIWVCHFAGNTAPLPWDGAGTTLNGDYVLNYEPGGPLPYQTAYCAEHGGLGVITIAAAAAMNGSGHQAIQLTERIELYP